MGYIPQELRQQVIARADHRCEYCGLSQWGQAATFHIDHVMPLAAGGPTTLDNLALACVACSLYKGARQHATDPETGTSVPLFNPRQGRWEDHFAWEDVEIKPRTPVGRATCTLLQMNRPMMLAIREEEIWLGRHPNAE